MGGGDRGEGEGIEHWRQWRKDEGEREGEIERRERWARVMTRGLGLGGANGRGGRMGRPGRLVGLSPLLPLILFNRKH